MGDKTQLVALTFATRFPAGLLFIIFGIWTIIEKLFQPPSGTANGSRTRDYLAENRVS